MILNPRDCGFLFVFPFRQIPVRPFFIQRAHYLHKSPVLFIRQFIIHCFQIRLNGAFVQNPIHIPRVAFFRILNVSQIKLKQFVGGLVVRVNCNGLREITRSQFNLFLRVLQRHGIKIHISRECRLFSVRSVLHTRRNVHFYPRRNSVHRAHAESLLKI